MPRKCGEWYWGEVSEPFRHRPWAFLRPEGLSGPLQAGGDVPGGRGKRRISASRGMGKAGHPVIKSPAAL